MNLHIENFQSIADATLTVSGFTAITGPSNRGKSASLRAVSGALFNRPGDDFVRLGASQARVSITELPVRDSCGAQPIAVVWTKGKSANRFQIDGLLYDKVGTGAPAVMTDYGYRDIWIGDRERDKGEAIRPQVSGQFDGLFLLGRPGSFIADTIALISRVTTLRTAHGRAVSDLRAIKQVRGIRVKDLEAAQNALERLSPVRALDTRCEALGLRLVAVQAQESRLTALRAALTGLARLKPLLTAVLPAPVPVPETLGASLEAARALLVRRTVVSKAVATPLPKVYRSEGLMLAMARIKEMRFLVAARAGAKGAVFNAVAAARAMAGELEEAEAALSALLASVKVCPFCAQEMPHAG